MKCQKVKLNIPQLTVVCKKIKKKVINLLKNVRAAQTKNLTNFVGNGKKVPPYMAGFFIFV